MAAALPISTSTQSGTFAKGPGRFVWIGLHEERRLGERSL
jgi:hypothetical protein